MPPLVSILVPVYNTVEYVDKCLDSIVRQNYERLQVIMIDDGSSDDSFKVCRRYSEKYPFVSAYTREHRGIVHTRRELLDKATGEYVLFVDSDDWIECDMISGMVELISDSGADMAMCGMHYGNMQLFPMCLNSGSGIRVFDRAEVLHSFFNFGVLMNSLCNKLVKIAFYKDLKYRSDIGAGEDLCMMWQILPKIEKAVCTPALYYHYENNEGSLTRKSEMLNLETACNLWMDLEKESYHRLPSYTSQIKRRVFLEASSYSYLLFRQGNPPKETIKKLIDIMRPRLTFRRLDSKQQLAKTVWGLAGIIGGYRLMSFVSDAYHAIRRKREL